MSPAHEASPVVLGKVQRSSKVGILAVFDNGSGVEHIVKDIVGEGRIRNKEQRAKSKEQSPELFGG